MRAPFALSGAAGCLALTFAVFPAPDLAGRITGAPDGDVRMTYAARPGMCSRNYHSEGQEADIEWDDSCERGPIHVAFKVSAHQVTRIHVYIGGRWRARPGLVITDLGEVSSREAAGVLMGFAEQLPSHVGGEAIMAATFADSAEIWPRLGVLARDDTKPTDTRKQAVFWLGQAAANATGMLDSIAEAPDVNREVREQAIFAISQRPRDEAVPVLIRIVKTNSDPALRKKAMFWLGETGDPRAIELFESILTGSGR